MTSSVSGSLGFLLWTSILLGSILCEGTTEGHPANQTKRFKRKPYYYVSTQSDLLLPDIHVTFPAFDTQVPATKQQIDLAPNSIIRYTPVYEKQLVPTASHQHFERILNKIKSFKRKLKMHRKKYHTTPQYPAVSVEPLAMTPIAVPAYDYFPVGPDYLHQYLQISHKYDRQSCIYLKISEDSFMKVQCYPILPHTDQVETYPNSYNNEVLTNPDVANVYHTLVPNAPEPYPQNSIYNIELFATTSPLPYDNVPYSNSYYYQGGFSKRPTYPGYTPHSPSHSSAPLPPSHQSSGASLTKYSKPNKVLHSNKTSLPFPVTLPSNNGLNVNFIDKILVTTSNGSHGSGNGIPVDNKNEVTDNDSPTKISLLNHAIAPLDVIEPTQKSDLSKTFFRPDDTIVVEASTEKHITNAFSTSTSHSFLPIYTSELNYFPTVGFTNIYDRTEIPQIPTYPEGENTISTASMIENFSEYDKSVFETTVAVSGTTSGITPFDPTERTQQPVETTSITDGTSDSEDRIFDPAEKSGFTHKNQEGTSASTFVTSDMKELPTSTSETISGHLETTIETEEKQLFTAVTTTLEYPDVNTDLKQVPDSTTTYTIISDNNVITTEENEMRKLMTTMVTSNNNFDSTTHFEVLTSVVPTANMSPTSEPESDLRNLISTTSGTLDKYGFTTVTDARYLDTTTFSNNIASTNDGSPDDLRQIPTSTTDNYLFSTTKSLPDTTTEAPETTTEARNIENSSDDLRRILPTTTEDTVSTTQNSLEHDLRKIATTKTETYDATHPSTTDSSPDDFRQLPTTTVDSTINENIHEHDLRGLPTTTESFENNSPSTTENTVNDLRNLPTTTVISTTESSPDDLRQLPTTTTENPVPTTTEDTSENDLRQLPVTTESFESNGPSTSTYTTETNVRQLLTTTTITYDNLIPSGESSPDDLRQLLTTTENPVSTTPENDLRQFITTVQSIEKDVESSTESSPNELRQLSTFTTERSENSLEDLQAPTTSRQTTTTVTESERSLTANPSTDNNEDLPLSTTDDSITWFTSDIDEFDDTFPRQPLSTLALVRSGNPTELSTNMDTTLSVKNETRENFATRPYVPTTPQLFTTSTENVKSIEDNEIIPHEIITENAEEKIQLIQKNKGFNKIGNSNVIEDNNRKITLNRNNKTMTQNSNRLDKNTILSLSSEDIKQEYGRKIPLETDEGNIVKVLEKNGNTGNWEVQFYKVNANNTSLNSEDIDLPRRSDVLISDYDGYDNIDSDGEEQYEYDYRAKNSSVVEDLGKLPLALNPKKLTDEPNQRNEISNNMNSSGRNKRDGSYNVEELEQLNNSYEKMKESNSSVLSEIKDITQNNTENNNGTNLNVNYLDDFLKLTDKVRKYYDEKKETIRTKRNVIGSHEKSEFLELKHEYEKSNHLSHRNKRLISPLSLYRTNLKYPERTKRNERDTTLMNIIGNSIDNTTTENIKNNTGIKDSLVPELLQNGNSTDYSPSSFASKLKNAPGNNNSTVVKFVKPLYKNSKFLDIKTTPNYYTITKQSGKSKFGSFNSSVFNFEHKIETTTELQKEVFSAYVAGGSTNKTYIYKHKNTSNVVQNDLYASPVPVLADNITSSQVLQSTAVSSGSDKADNFNNTQIVLEKSNKRNMTLTHRLMEILKRVPKNNTSNVNYTLSSPTDNNTSQVNNSNVSAVDYPKSGYQTNFINTITPDKSNKTGNSTRFVQHTINLIKNITALLIKQNNRSKSNAVNRTDDDGLGKVKDFGQTANKSYELKFIIGKTVNSTSSDDGIFVPLYVEMLLMTQIVLLLALLTFFIFLHYADSRMAKRQQYDTSVTYLNNAFERDRVFNDLP